MVTIEIKKLGEGSFTERTQSIVWDSLKIRQALTKEVDSCSFDVEKYGNKTFKPGEEDEIIVRQDGVKIFAGFVVRVRETLGADMVLKYECEAKDYTHLLNRKLVNKTYTGQTELQIITDIVNSFSAGGLTLNHVDGSEIVDQITFNNFDPSAAIQKLTEIFNKDWYIDYDKDIHYFSKEANVAPFILSDTNGNYILDSLEITNDTTQVKNSIFVEGGQELSDAVFTEKFIADGTQYTFSVSYQYENLTLKLNGINKTVGKDGEGDFTAFDALYNSENFSLRFNPSSPPANGAIIEFGGNYFFPIKTLVRESTSITKFGEKQFQIIDPNIKNREVAKKRAQAEIYAYAASLNEGSFESYTSGLRAGQRILIQSDIRELNDYYLINNLEATLFNPNKVIWKATLVSVKTFDVMDLLAKIVDKSNLQTDVDEIVKTAEIVLRTLKVSRSIQVQTPQFKAKIIELARQYLHYLNDPPIWVAGPYSPNSLSDRKRPAFADRGCLLGS